MKVLVIDDHPSILEGVRTVLLHEFAITTFQTAGTSEDAISAAAAEPWSLIITDLSIPGRGGPELVSELARFAPGARILVHTVHSEKQFGVRALRAGAHGYVTKDQPLEILLEAVHRLLQGKRYISAGLAEDLLETLQHGSGTAPADLLSDRELQVLKLMAKGLSPGDIAVELHLSGKTVSTYRSRMLEKLRLSSTADLIRYALENNLQE